MGVTLKLAVILLVTLIVVSELEAAKVKKPARKSVTKKPAVSGKRTYYQKGEGDKCKTVKQCNIYLGLDCHPKKQQCVCIFSLQEFNKEKGCHWPGEKDEVSGSGSGSGEGGGDVTDETETDPELECDECDEVVPDGGDETEEEKRRRRKFSRFTAQVAKARRATRKLKGQRGKGTKKPKSG